MSTTAAPRPRKTRKTERPPSEPHPELDVARSRWLAEGDTPENVADYARALRALIEEPRSAH